MVVPASFSVDSTCINRLLCSRFEAAGVTALAMLMETAYTGVGFREIQAQMMVAVDMEQKLNVICFEDN